MIDVKIINKSRYALPEYKTVQSAGVDLRSNLPTTHTLMPMERILVPTGLFLQMPEGYEAQIRPRSGLSLKEGIVAILGTIDADYRGEVGIILINLSNKAYAIKPGERYAQMVFNKIEQANFSIVYELEETERGDGGFGHTGIR